MEKMELQKHINTVLAEMTLRQIENDQQYNLAAEFLVKAKQTAKEVENQFGPALEEAKEEKRKAEAKRKEIDNEIKRFTKPLSQAEQTVKRMMSAYQMEQEKRRREAEEKARREAEEKRLAEAVETDNEELLNEPVQFEQPKYEAPKADNTYTVQVWKFRIKDKKKINPDYLIPDEKLIGQIVRSKKADAATILGEGVEVYSETEIRARA